MSSFYPTDKEDEALLIEYARTCSDLCFDDLFLKRLDFDKRLRKEIAEKMNRAIDNLAIVRLVEMLRQHPELRLTAIAAPPKRVGLSHENLHRDPFELRGGGDRSRRKQKRCG